MIIITFFIMIVIDKNSCNLLATIIALTSITTLANSILKIISTLNDNVCKVADSEFIRINMPSLSIMLKIGLINIIILMVISLVAGTCLETKQEMIKSKEYYHTASDGTNLIM